MYSTLPLKSKRVSFTRVPLLFPGSYAYMSRFLWFTHVDQPFVYYNSELTTARPDHCSPSSEHRASTSMILLGIIAPAHSTQHTAHSTALNLTSRICIAYILQHNTQLQIRPAQTSASATITAQLPVRSSSPTARPGIRPQHGTAHSYLLGITFTALAR